MDPEERLSVLLRHTAEAVTEAELEEVLRTSDRPSVYVGYAPTGEMHIGHYTTIRKLVDFLKADLEVTVLIADLHAHLDDTKSPLELLDARSRYYREAISEMVAAGGGDPDAIDFVRGSSFELDPPYTRKLYELAAEISTTRTQRAGSEVVRQQDNPTLGSLLYTVMQSLDVAALNADIAYGGIDQRGIYMLAREYLPTIGEEKPRCLFAPLLAGLDGGKMSASEQSSSISLTDSNEMIEEKLFAAYCPAEERANNGILDYLEYLVFPIMERCGDQIHIERPPKYGGNVRYGTYTTLESDFLCGDLHPQDLKQGTATALQEIVNPIRASLLADKSLLVDAYPEAYD